MVADLSYCLGMTDVKSSNNMSWGGHLRATAVLGVPLIGSHLAQMLTNTTDVVMMGWYGVPDLAATVLAMQLYFVTFIVGAGFAFAVMPMVAAAVSEEDEISVRRAVRMGIWISLGYSVLAMPFLWNFKWLASLLGQDPEIAALAQDYMHIAQWSIFPALLIMVLKSYLAALERAQIVLWATVTAALANGFFNYMLIFGNFGAPEMGIRGAALASVGTTAISFLFLWAYAAVHPDLQRYAIFLRLWRADWGALASVARLGGPIGLTMLAESGLFAATALMMGWIGTVELATHGIIMQITALVFMIPLGLSNVATVRVGRAYGRKDGLGLWRASVTVLVVSLLIAGVAMTLMLSIPETLIGVFLDSGESARADILRIGVPILATAATFTLVDAAQVAGLGMLRGVRDTFMPMVFAVFSYWIIGLPVGYLFGIALGFGGVGIWSGLVVGLTIAAITMNGRYFHRLAGIRRGFEGRA